MKPIITKQDEYHMLKAAAHSMWAAADDLIEERIAEQVKPEDERDQTLIDALIVAIDKAQTEAEHFDAAASKLYNDPATWAEAGNE